MLPARTFILAGLLVVLTAFAAFQARAVEVQRVVSPGGIEAWLVEDHSNPIIALELAFRGGASLDPATKPGLAYMVSTLIDEGAGPLDSQSFQGALDDLSINLRFQAGLDGFNGSLSTLTENSGRAFELLRLALTAPRFDPEPVERIRSQILSRLSREAEDPDVIAGRTLRRLMFQEHPYARPTRGTEASIAAITSDDLHGFVRARFGRDELFVGVVGDITPEALKTVLDQTFLPLPVKAEPFSVAEAAVQSAGDLVVIEKNIPQSVVSLGQAGIKRDDPDYYAAYVVNHVLGGGGFSSRLVEEVREKRGLAYSVYSYLGPLDHGALVGGGVATQNERVGESLDLIRAEWARMADEGPSAEELEQAKRFLTGSFPLRFSSSGNIAGMLVGMQLEDLGIDYLDKRNSFIEAVDLAMAQRVAKRLYRPDDLTVVVVGAPAGVTPTREAPAGGS
ncbi:insulinase family protein [Pelagibius litoralis]|uniref:Insulinase family protein n=2 Tax=Pelagibius litoralis TaxID=374515 RepID=A0A967F162_9PROT|nr:insulinase family protein [Pelagibius litoralis]